MNRPLRSLSLMVVLASLSLSGCGGEMADGMQDDVNCSSCHGGPENAAPPVSISGESKSAAPGVGAHQEHLRDGDLRKAIACGECHRVPEEIAEEGHIDPLPAELTWGPLASDGGDVSPIWERQPGRCDSTYCHGSTLSGGSNTAPLWGAVGQGQTDCGTCHGAPPPAPHPSSTECRLCHPGTMTEDGEIDVEGGLHINGELEVVGGACNACHGNEDNAAPPRSLSGSMDTTETEVGAHQAHLTDGSLRTALDCDACHVVPETQSAPSHMDESPAEVTWGFLAKVGDQEPVWDREADSCSSAYCHGSTLSGGSNTAPTWTGVDQGQTACGTCHGAPPPPPHP